MPRIPEVEIERLKGEIALERLVEDSGIELRRGGKDLLARCPFHEDAEASLVVTSAKNLWHCFGCGAGGGPIDWVMRKNGVSFRHAVELLREGTPSLAAKGTTTPGTVKSSTVRRLAAPVERDADDQELLNQVVDYYHETLKASPEALAYLKSRGLEHPELIDRFRLGYANRTLGLRLPAKTRIAGAELRTRLQKIGLYRESGHEHFNGSLVVPILDAAGNVTEVYGRKITANLRPGTPLHLYLPGPHRGVWNLEAFRGEGAEREIILAESLIDAMSFWCAGFRNATAAYGVEGFTDELLTAFKSHGIERVLIAYDRDEAGDRAAERLAARLIGEGMEAWRIQFPRGMDANEYACKVTPAAKSLGLAIRKAQWLGKGAAPVGRMQEPATSASLEVANCDLKMSAVATVGNPVLTSSPAGEPASESITATPLAAKEESEPAPAASSSPLSSAFSERALPATPVPPAPQNAPEATVSDSEVVMRFGEGEAERRYRVRGLQKNLAVGVLKVNVMVGNAQAFHVDTLDLYAARPRALFVQQAAAELHVKEEIVRAEMGRLLLKLEALQDEAIARALEPKAPLLPAMNEAEREAALALLRAPNLIERILEDFERCGVVGEATNKLAGYLAATSRKLARPLAVVIQSSSAAGKSSLMDAVLALMPPEDTVRYSAMTGQSLFYLGKTHLKHRLLAIAEEEGAHRAAYALKLLQSEGELSIASTGTDAAGNLVTQEYRVEGPLSLFMTTTAIEIDEELLNRCLVLAVDEGREQTRAIHARQRAGRTLAGLAAREQKAALLTLHRNAQRLLRPLAVVNPYAERLTFLDERTRTRRDHEKYLTLIDTIALLHQHQRPIRTIATATGVIEYIEASLEDIAIANRLTHEVLGRSLDELSPQTRGLLMEIDALVAERARTEGLPRAEVRFTRGELRRASGLGDTQLRVHLERLVALEYVLAHRGARGLSFVYELLYDGAGRAGEPFVPGLIDIEALRAMPTTITSRGVEPHFAGPSRPHRGPNAGGSRGTESPAVSESARDSEDLHPENPIRRPMGPNGHAPSYPQADVVPLAAGNR